MSNWGFVKFLAELLQPVLAGIEGFVHDWGLAVILFTLCVRLVLFPMTVRQARFAWRSRLFTKAFKEVQEKHKNNQDKMKEETTRLALEHKFNPFGMIGTMILQMPIFAAVYAVFYHFGGDITSVLVPWASALGSSDPYHIMPLLAAVVSALGALVPVIEPEEVKQIGLNAKLFPIVLMFSMMLMFMWKAPVAIALYMGTTSLWGMVERTFLRSRFAVRKLKLNPALTATTHTLQDMEQEKRSL